MVDNADNVSVRTITGRANSPQLYLTKELKQLKLKPGDKVAVIVEGNKITIQRAKIEVEV